MTDSLNLSAEQPVDPGALARFQVLRDAAAAVDGRSAFNDQALTDVAAHKRTLLLVEHDSGTGASKRAVGAAILGGSELEFVVDPSHRCQGYGRRMLQELLVLTPPDVLAWSHGDHPAARALAARHGFDSVRTLLQLRLSLLPPEAVGAEVDEVGDPSIRSQSGPPADREQSGIIINPFRVGEDEAEWLDVNARVFADHPEQGKLTMEDLQAREGEEWFDAHDFLIARDSSDDDRMVGFNWLKVEPMHPESGEIYAIGVDASHAGRGLGRRLMLAGLARLVERGEHSATLYVEADNTAAVNLYRSLGFIDLSIDVQYRRRA